MTFHFRDQVDVNLLTIDACDPKSGTAEFKATAVRVEKLNGEGPPDCWSRPAARLSSSVDVRLLDAEPTTVERAAIDAFLGPPVSSWVGADRVDDGHSAHGGHSARAERQQLLPTLHALHERTGWISPGALNYVAQRLTIPPADVYGVATFYALFSLEPRTPRVLHVCDDVSCRCAGSESLLAALTERIGPEGIQHGDISWLRARAWVSATARPPRC